MKRIKKPIYTLLTAAMIAGTLSGCFASGSTTGAESVPPPRKEPFDLTVCLAPNPETMDPALNCAVDGGSMLLHFFEGLMKYSDDGEGNAVLAAGQAESYEKEEHADGTVTYTFKLRDDIFWSDGKPVAAGDFVYAWQRLADPGTAAAYCYMLDMVAGANEVMRGQAEPSALGVRAPDDATLVVELTYDCPYFLGICAFPALLPVRRDMIEANGDQWTFAPETYLSNGIYKMTEWTQNDRIVALPNEYHYDAANLGPDSITFRFLDDANAIYSAFRAGDFSFIESVPVDETAALLENGTMRTADHLGTYYICFNNRNYPFDDPRVRQAFSLVIDSPYLVHTITQTGETPASGLVPYGVYDAGGAGQEDFRTTGGAYWEIPVTAEVCRNNCDRARALLAEAGYPGGEGFPIVEYLYNTDDRNRTIAEAMQSMWAAELGVTVTLVNQDWGAVLQSCFDGDYQMACGVWIADYNDPVSFLDIWQTGGGNNIAHYSNAEFDEALCSAKTARTPAERMGFLHRAEDILIGRDRALAPIFFYTYSYCVHPDLKGVCCNPLGYVFFGYSRMAR